MAIADNTLSAVGGTPIRRPVPRRLVVGAAILAIACGAATFLLPLLGEHPTTRIIVNDRRAPGPRTAVAGSAPGTTSRGNSLIQAPSPSPSPSVVASKPNDPSDFSLSRSGRYQTFGPIKLRLGRTEPRKGLYDLTVNVGARSFVHRNVRINEALWVSLPKGSSAAQIVVKRVQSGRITGYWNEAEQPLHAGTPVRHE